MKIKILVVDDESDILEILNDFLSQEGFHVSMAQTPAEFRKLTFEVKPDLIILDIILGNENGAQIHRDLVDQGLDRKTPVIFLTGLAQDRPPSHAGPGRTCSMLPKPFQLEDLIKEINCLLNSN